MFCEQLEDTLCTFATNPNDRNRLGRNCKNPDAVVAVVLQHIGGRYTIPTLASLFQLFENGVLAQKLVKATRVATVRDIPLL